MINRKHYLFVLSVDGMLEKEALVALANLSRFMVKKIDELIS